MLGDYGFCLKCASRSTKKEIQIQLPYLQAMNQGLETVYLSPHSFDNRVEVALVRWISLGESLKNIALDLGISLTEAEIALERLRARGVNLQEGDPRPFTEREDREIAEIRNLSQARAIARQEGRTLASVRSRRDQLRIRGRIHKYVPSAKVLIERGLGIKKIAKELKIPFPLARKVVNIIQQQSIHTGEIQC